MQHRCLLLKVPFLTKAMDESEFERSGERRADQSDAGRGNFRPRRLIAAVLAGAGLMKLGCFDPGLVASGQLRKVLTDWSCPGGFPIYALYRKTARMSPKLAAFLGFVAEAFEAFDPEEITLLHDSSLANSLRRAARSSASVQSPCSSHCAHSSPGTRNEGLGWNAHCSSGKSRKIGSRRLSFSSITDRKSTASRTAGADAGIGWLRPLGWRSGKVARRGRRW